MSMSQQTLDELEEAYGRALVFNTHAAELLDQLDLADDLQRRFLSARFARIEDVVPSPPMTALAMALSSILRPISDEIVARHHVRPDGRLSDGYRFLCIDPTRVTSPSRQAQLAWLLDRLGIIEFGRQLGGKLAPLIRHIVGNVTYRHAYLYVYEEGDYISAHDDRQVSDRVDVQFPVTIDGIGGIRVLTDGLFQMHYDAPGTMNILGPLMWHEVPPLVRMRPGTAPVRVNIGLRYTPD